MSAGVIEEYVEADDGVRLWTATSGSGSPLVLCHGGPGLWDDQGPIVGMVSDLVTVHRWDQRGCGRSTGSGPYTVQRFVADLEDIREHFGHARWIVGGHSWGATLALRYAFAMKTRWRAAVLLRVGAPILLILLSLAYITPVGGIATITGDAPAMPTYLGALVGMELALAAELIASVAVRLFVWR